MLVNNIDTTVKVILNQICKDYNINEFRQSSQPIYEAGGYRVGDWTYNIGKNSIVTIVKWLSSTNPRLTYIKTTFARDEQIEKLESDLRNGIESLLNVKL